MSQVWGQVATTYPSPPTPNGRNGWGMGGVVGHHFYWIVNDESGAPGATSTMWRWAPVAGGRGGAPAAAAASGVDPADAGQSFGIALGVILGLANLYVLVAIAQGNAIDLVPAALAPYLPAACGGSGGSRPGPSAAGFYASANADSGAEYKAPAM